MAWSDEARRRSAEVRRLKALMRKRAESSVKKAKKTIPWQPKMNRTKALEWAKQGVYPETVYRVGSLEAAEAAGEQGFDMDKRGYFMHGKGGYFAVDSDTLENYIDEPEFKFSAWKVKLKNPLLVVFDDPEDWDVGTVGARRIVLDAAGLKDPDEIGTLAVSESRTTAKLHELGYDGIFIQDVEGWHGTPGGNQVVVFDPQNITQISGSIQEADAYDPESYVRKWRDMDPDGGYFAKRYEELAWERMGQRRKRRVAAPEGFKRRSILDI